MENRTNYLTATVDTGATQFALEHLRMYPLKTLSTVIITPKEYDSICVTFLFDKHPNFGYKIDVLNAFCVGYRGEGPWGLHDIMIEAGFPKSIAEKVFTISRYEETILKK